MKSASRVLHYEHRLGVITTYTVEVELPDKLREEINDQIRLGLFKDQNEVLRHAALDHLRRNNLALIERQQLADISWALDADAQTKAGGA